MKEKSDQSDILSEEISPIYSSKEFQHGSRDWPHLEHYLFSPYGLSSVETPDFIISNFGKVSSDFKSNEFQCTTLSGLGTLKSHFLHYFPEMSTHFKSVKSKLSLENILISNGDLRGISLCVETFCSNSGDEFVFFAPCYPYHLSRTNLRKDIVIKNVHLKFDKHSNRFEIDFDELKKTLTNKTRILLITNPNNPTTRVFTKEELEKISSIVKEHKDLIVIEDRAYFNDYIDNNHIPVPFAILNDNFNRTITTWSLGKMFHCTGMRVGAILGPTNLIRMVSQNYPADLQITSSVEQNIMASSLKDAYEMYRGEDNYFEYNRKEILRKVEWVRRELIKTGLEEVKYEGTHYLVLNISRLKWKIKEQYCTNDFGDKLEHLDKIFSRALYQIGKIGVMPLSKNYVDKDKSNVPDNFVRVALNRNDNDLQMFIEALKYFMKNCLLETTNH